MTKIPQHIPAVDVLAQIEILIKLYSAGHVEIDYVLQYLQVAREHFELCDAVDDVLWAERLGIPYTIQ